MAQDEARVVGAEDAPAPKQLGGMLQSGVECNRAALLGVQPAVDYVVGDEVLGEHPATPRCLAEAEVFAQASVFAEAPVRRLEQLALTEGGTRRGEAGDEGVE